MDRPTHDPAGLRASYENGTLSPDTAPADPLELFATWFEDAVAAGLSEPNAMVLATASADAVPNARVVLLKGYGPAGFRFFTNHTSHKARDLAANPRAALVFPWHAMSRQVRVSGPALRLTPEESTAYFRTRPYGSQIGAWASERQSSVVDDRAELDSRYADLAERWPDPAVTGAEVPRPEFWGGYRVVPEEIEFWQGRPDRMHDRVRYRRAAPVAFGAEADAEWTAERLSP
ncbi:pyridoxamine 5'-phosphate oxidase [Actinomadura flavalba]|uniref:pyridoxamine 5'-phosphate oxidase n=1 Tax=Actinomadura flavalba TaxID=1120938 RepID=UPI00035C55B8|nr:pyridoxamine 5'-phosphate oxidase [Actinomadura flavalba]